ncbi:hypothetical protein [Mucilaginibacter sp. R-33]|uniref:hypothetical protein n=1 Tax=Mucilaginibacter sp. R-33 TaxID=3416711 RepID=UPI003CF97CF9
MNDAYTSYLSFNKPGQLSKTQADLLKKQNNDAAILKENITVNDEGTFSKKT